MKKQTIYLFCTMKDMKEKTIQEVEGYVIDLTNNFGYTVKIGLHFKRPYWYATHYETGLACTPYVEGKNYRTGLIWKSKEALIERIKAIDFKRLEEVGKDFHNQCKQIIKAYKEQKQNETQDQQN